MTDILQQRQAEYVIENVGDTNARVLIGGRDDATGGLAAQNVNLSWTLGNLRDEFWINVNRPGGTAEAGEIIVDGALILPSGDIFHLEGDRLKWDIRFDEHPRAYSWAFRVTDSGNVGYHYQPALTDEEIAAGDNRPEEITGSYAVYGDKRHGSYGTGKLCHIPAPLCKDADGREIYGTLDITDGVMTISIDQEWMDSAAYPVLLDPTFGFTSSGASNSTMGLPYRTLEGIDSYEGTTGATITEIHAWLFNYQTSPTVPIGVFDKDDGYSKLVDVVMTSSHSTPFNESVTGLSAAVTDAHTYIMANSDTNAIYMTYDTYATNASKRITTYADPLVDDTPGALFSTKRWSMYAVYEASASGTVDVTEPDDYTVWQRRGSGDGEKQISISGTYTGTPTAIQARIVEHGTDTPVTGLDWQTVDAAPSGGTWSGTITLPAGGWYNIDIRFSNDTEVIYTGLNRFGVGDVFILYGQSQMATLWTYSVTAITPNSLSALMTTSDGVFQAVTSQMALTYFLNAIIAQTGVPAMAIGAARPNTHAYELEQGTEPYSDLIACATTQDSKWMFYNQGTSDVWSGTAYSVYKDTVEGLLDDLAVDLAAVLDGSFDMGMSVLANTTTDLSDTKIDDIRRAHLDILAARTSLLNIGTNQDLTLLDGTHNAVAGAARMCERMALTVFKTLGLTAYDARGPVLSSMVYDTSNNQVRFNYAMNGGSALTVDSGDPAAIEIFGNGVAAAPDSWSVSGTQVIAQYTTLPTLPITATVAYGYSAAGWDPWVNVRDNYTTYTTDGLPIPPTSAPVTATESTGADVSHNIYFSFSHVRNIHINKTSIC